MLNESGWIVAIGISVRIADFVSDEPCFTIDETRRKAAMHVFSFVLSLICCNISFANWSDKIIVWLAWYKNKNYKDKL